jgi:iron(III) transport system permease protein
MRSPTTSSELWQKLGLTLVVLIIFSPLLALISNALISLGKGHWDWLSLALPWGRRGHLLWQSIKLAGVVAIAGTMVGTVIACLGWQYQTVRRWRWCLLPLLLIPPYIHALAWSKLGTVLGEALTLVGINGDILSPWWGCVWIELMAWLPLAVGLALIGFLAVPIEPIEAARLLVKDEQVLQQVVLPLAMPSFWASGALLFLLSLTDYSIPSLFGVSSYALEIFAEYSASNEPIRAFFLALPLLLVSALGIIFLQAPLQQTLQKRIQCPAWQIPWQWPPWLLAIQAIAAGLGLLQIIVPLGSLAVINLQEAQYPLNTLESALPDAAFTLGLAGATAVLSLPLALGMGALLQKEGPWQWLVWTLLIGALILPAPLVGVGLIALGNSPWGNPFYGGLAMPLLAHLARFAPMAALILFAQQRQLDPNLWDSTFFVPGPRWRVWLYLRFPLVLPGLLAAASVVFAFSAGELGATLIVIPPGYSTLTLRIYNYLHYGASGEVALLCLLMVGAAAMVGGFVSMLLLISSSLLGQGRKYDQG